MKIALRTGLAVAAAAAIGSGAWAADAIRGGLWEFTSQMQAPGLQQLPPGVSLPAGVQMPAGGGMSAKHNACIDPERAVPVDPRQGCRIERFQRNGTTVTWSSSCTTAQGTVRSDGVAQYSGNTMQATMTTQVPGAGGAMMQTRQQITGRYLGPCQR